MEIDVSDIIFFVLILIVLLNNAAVLAFSSNLIDCFWNNIFFCGAGLEH